MIANLQSIAIKLFAPWKELTASESNIKSNLEIVLEIFWAYLLMNRYVGDLIDFPEGIEKIVQKIYVCAENINAYFAAEVDLNLFETVRFLGHTLLLSSFCVKEMKTCPFRKKAKINKKDVLSVDSGVMQVDTTPRALRSNNVALVPPLEENPN